MAKAKSDKASPGRCEKVRKPAQKAGSKAVKVKRRKHGWWRRTALFLMRVSWIIGWRAVTLVILAIAISTGYYLVKLPSVDDLLESRTQGSAVLLDRNNVPFAWRGSQFGGPISANNVSPFLKHAVIATEDKRFYSHFGLSPRGIVGAVLINLREGRGPFRGHGGSTITQQVAKLICFGKNRDETSDHSEAQFERDCRRTTIWRKIKEIPFSFALEIKYAKDEILTIYLNRVYLGAGATGFEAASQRYFGVSIRDVTPAQAAMLAGLLKAPSVYAPTRNTSKAIQRANLIVGLMEKQGYLSVAEAHEAVNSPAELSSGAAAKAGNYFADWVMDSDTVPAFLFQAAEDVVLRTTLDMKIQKAVDEALVHVFETKVKSDSRAEAAIVVMSPDGAVRAMTGGRNPRATGQFNRATQALRQTGSAFKPFVYAAALESGVSPDDIVNDSPISLKVPGSGTWTPRNYNDRYEGNISVERAFSTSSNVVAVQLLESVGRSKVANIVRRFGVQNDLAEGPALALGASESTLLEMTGAYAGFLNGGFRSNPYGFIDLRIRGEDQVLFSKTSFSSDRAVRKETALHIIEMMQSVIENGTGKRAMLKDHSFAGKTGTTQAARDAWFIGFSSDYVAGVWMGYDDNTPLTGVTGGGLPAEIWRVAMERIHQGMKPKPLPAPI